MIKKLAYKIIDDNYVFDSGVYPRVSKILETISWGAKPIKIYEERLITKYFIEHYGKPNIGKELLKEALAEPKRELERTSIFGNAIHDSIEDYINTKKEIALFNDIRKDTCINSFKKFYNEWNIGSLISLGCEIPVFSKIFGYAGCLDWLAKDTSGNIFLFDWKTSNAFRDKYYLQAVSYWQAVKEMFGLEIKQAHVIVFDKATVKFSHRTIQNTEFNKYFDVFKNVLGAYNFANK